jgi:hypothetical protein
MVFDVKLIFFKSQFIEILPYFHGSFSLKF